ncbi:translation initiation factor IF-2-like [Camelus ferus]|uniref:Translation initiation factor IF-2-like n=1 Tax=Camelus ferus TaxID=419612 RepID=A0A8B8TKE3_CAMFR|nr:translation initiation factor IF-2-like [Camelus ferus]
MVRCGRGGCGRRAFSPPPPERSAPGAAPGRSRRLSPRGPDAPGLPGSGRPRALPSRRRRSAQRRLQLPGAGPGSPGSGLARASERRRPGDCPHPPASASVRASVWVGSYPKPYDEK